MTSAVLSATTGSSSAVAMARRIEDSMIPQRRREMGSKRESAEVSFGLRERSVFI